MPSLPQDHLQEELPVLRLVGEVDRCIESIADWERAVRGDSRARPYHAAMSATLPGLNDCARELAAVVESQTEVAEHTYRLRLNCPELARVIRPGQFFMVRPNDGSDPLLGRPFAVYDIVLTESGEPVGVDLGYHTVGKLTGQMPSWHSGEEVTVWGPLGNGFPDLDVDRLLFVAGGIGYTPAVAVMRRALGLQGYAGEAPRRRSQSVEMIYGARTASLVADCSDFASEPGFTLSTATDDGTAGHHGFVTDLLADRLAGPTKPQAVFTCGPGVMMQRVAEQCLAVDVDCWLSLESPMACGFGACFSCVAKVHTDDGGWDYRRTCVEGPVFRANELVLDELNC